MDNLDDIKQVWLSANVTALPKTADIIKTIKRYRRKQIFKALALTIIIVLLFVTMCHVLFFYHSQLLSTRIGEACIFIAIFLLLSINIRSIKKISSLNTFSNSEFLEYLKKDKLKCIRSEGVTQKIGFSIASAGLLFYIFEEVHKQLSVMLISYAAVIAWCCISWFVIRPIAIKRKTNRINETITKLEQFSKQLENQSN